MSLSSNKALIRSFVEEVFNNHDLSALERYFSEKNPPKRNEEFRKSLNIQFKAFPDIRVEIEHIMAEGDLVVIFLSFNATHKGENKH